MATIPPNTRVDFDQAAVRHLRYPPPGPSGVIAAHPGALRSPNPGTLAVVFDDADVVMWVGAIDERMIRSHGLTPEPGRNSRTAIRSLLYGPRGTLDVVYPGPMLRYGSGHIETTVPKRDRPWVVIGALENGDSLAAPLTGVRNRVMWFNPVVGPPDLLLYGSKRSQVRLPSLWSFPPRQPIGQLVDDAADDVQTAALRYYRKPRDSTQEATLGA